MLRNPNEWSGLSVSDRAHLVASEPQNVTPLADGTYSLIPEFVILGQGKGPDMRGNTPDYKFFAGGSKVREKMAAYRDIATNRLVADDCRLAAKYITPSLGAYVNNGLIGKQIYPRYSLGVSRFPVVRHNGGMGSHSTPADVFKNFGGIVEFISSGEPLADIIPSTKQTTRKPIEVVYTDIGIKVRDVIMYTWHVDTRFPPLYQVLINGTENNIINGVDQASIDLRNALCTMMLFGTHERWYTFHVPDIYENLPLTDIDGTSWGMSLLAAAMGIHLPNCLTGTVGWTAVGIPMLYPGGKYYEKGIISHELTGVTPVFVATQETQALAGATITSKHDGKDVTTLQYFDTDMLLVEDLEYRPYMYTYASFSGFSIALGALSRGIDAAPRGAEELEEVEELRSKTAAQLSSFGSYALGLEYMDEATRNRIYNVYSTEGEQAYYDAYEQEAEVRRKAQVPVQVPKFANHKKVLMEAGKGQIEVKETLNFPLFDFDYLTSPEVGPYLFKPDSPVVVEKNLTLITPKPATAGTAFNRWHTLFGTTRESDVRDWQNKGNIIALSKAFKRAYVGRQNDLDMSSGPGSRPATNKYTLGGGKRRKGLNKPGWGNLMQGKSNLRVTGQLVPPPPMTLENYPTLPSPRSPGPSRAKSPSNRTSPYARARSSLQPPQKPKGAVTFVDENM